MSCPPFSDPRVRRAFILATDGEALADVLWGGYVSPTTGGFVPPGMPGHSAGIALPYDSEAACQLLTEAGYSSGRDFPAVDWLTDPTDIWAEYLRAQWRETLGIEIKRKEKEWTTWPDLNEKLPHLFDMGWEADYPDPDNFLRVGLPWHWTGWSNEVYERMVEEARHLTDQGERMRLYKEADRILVEEVVILSLYYSRSHLLVKPWVSQVPTSLLNRAFLWKGIIIEQH